MKFIAIIIAFLIASPAFSQRPQPDSIVTQNGTIIMQPVQHGSLVLQWNDEVIYVDPHGGQKAYEDLKPPTIICITDIHGDHLDHKTLNSISTSNSIFIVPQAVADKLAPGYRDQILLINNSEVQMINDITFVAVPMYNLPESPDSRHPKGRGNGYIINLGGKNIYISGDTEDIPEMRNLNNIDVAFICMNLPYTMSIGQAASAVLDFKPKIVYPYHYRGKSGLSNVENFKKLVNDEDEHIEVRLRNWYPEY